MKMWHTVPSGIVLVSGLFQQAKHFTKHAQQGGTKGHVDFFSQVPTLLIQCKY